jgi:hypothetical protein
MQQRVIWIEHQGKEILRFNAQGADRPEQLAMLEDYAKALKGRPERSVLLLFEGGDIEFHPDVLTKGKAIFNELESRIQRSAVIGMTGVLKMAVQGYRESARLMGRDMDDKAKPFDNEAKALDWLVQA